MCTCSVVNSLAGSAPQARAWPPMTAPTTRSQRARCSRAHPLQVFGARHGVEATSIWAHGRAPSEWSGAVSAALGPTVMPPGAMLGPLGDHHGTTAACLTPCPQAGEFHVESIEMKPQCPKAAGVAHSPPTLAPPSSSSTCSMLRLKRSLQSSLGGVHVQTLPGPTSSGQKTRYWHLRHGRCAAVVYVRERGTRGHVSGAACLKGGKGLCRQRIPRASGG